MIKKIDNKLLLLTIKAKMNIEAIMIYNNEHLLYHCEYKTNIFFNYHKKNLKIPVTTVDEFNVLLKKILENNTNNNILTLENNKLIYKIMNYNEGDLYKENNLYETSSVYISNSYTYEAIDQFIAMSENEEIINYIKNVDDLNYNYGMLHTSTKLFDIIFNNKTDMNLISYIFEHEYTQYSMFTLLILLLKLNFEDMKMITHKYKYDKRSLLTYMFSLFGFDNNNIKNQTTEYLISLLLNYQRLDEMINLIISYMNPEDVKEFLILNISYLKNISYAELHNIIKYIKDNNIVSILHNDVDNTTFVSKIIDYDNIYFLKTNKMDIVAKCKNLVYLEFEGENINGISAIPYFLTMCKFNNCHITHELLVYLFTGDNPYNLYLLFNNCTFDKHIINKLHQKKMHNPLILNFS